jgi:putative ABC transport system ATP-binding protein
VDTETAEQLVTLLKGFNEQDQVTIVVVTHDLDVANQAKRLVLLKDGKVVADEPVASVAVAKSSP